MDWYKEEKKEEKKENSKSSRNRAKLFQMGLGIEQVPRTGLSIEEVTQIQTQPIQILNKQLHSEQELPLRRLYGTRFSFSPNTYRKPSEQEPVLVLQ